MKKLTMMGLVVLLGCSTYVWATKTAVSSSKSIATQNMQKTQTVKIYNKPNLKASIVQQYKDNYDLFIFQQIKSAWVKVADVKTGQVGWVNIKQSPQFKNISKAEVQRKILKDRQGKVIGITTSVNSEQVSQRVRLQAQQLQQAMDHSFMKIQQEMKRQENEMQSIFDNVFDYPSNQDRTTAPRYASSNTDQHYT